jgi:hypothetical protein
MSLDIINVTLLSCILSICCQFKCEYRVLLQQLFDYERLVHILLHIVSKMEQGGFVQRIGIYLLNLLACQVDGAQKQLLGDLGAISVIPFMLQAKYVEIALLKMELGLHCGMS